MMAAVTFNKLPDEPILIVAIAGSIADLAGNNRETLISILDAVSDPVFFILDMSNAQVSLEDIMRGASEAYLGDSPTLRHPNIREILHVSDDATLELATTGIDSAIFGNIRIQQFKMLEQALVYARDAQ